MEDRIFEEAFPCFSSMPEEEKDILRNNGEKQQRLFLLLLSKDFL